MRLRPGGAHECGRTGTCRRPPVAWSLWGDLFVRGRSGRGRGQPPEMIAVLLRAIGIAMTAFVLGSTLTPLFWREVMVRDSGAVVSPYAMVAGAILVAAIGYAIGQCRRS